MSLVSESCGCGEEGEAVEAAHHEAVDANGRSVGVEAELACAAARAIPSTLHAARAAVPAIMIPLAFMLTSFCSPSFAAAKITRQSRQYVNVRHTPKLDA